MCQAKKTRLSHTIVFPSTAALHSILHVPQNGVPCARTCACTLIELAYSVYIYKYSSTPASTSGLPARGAVERVAHG